MVSYFGKIKVGCGMGGAGADLRGDSTMTVPEHIRDKMNARGVGPIDGAKFHEMFESPQNIENHKKS